MSVNLNTGDKIFGNKITHKKSPDVSAFKHRVTDGNKVLTSPYEREIWMFFDLGDSENDDDSTGYPAFDEETIYSATGTLDGIESDFDSDWETGYEESSSATESSKNLYIEFQSNSLQNTTQTSPAKYEEFDTKSKTENSLSEIQSLAEMQNLHIELPKETMVQSIPQDEDYDSDDTRNNSIGELQNVAEHNLAAMQEITGFDRGRLRSTESGYDNSAVDPSTFSKQGLKETDERNPKVLIELSEFKPWLLKNVQTNDKSNPSFEDLLKLNEIANFNRGDLKTTKTSESQGKHIFLLEKLALEINNVKESCTLKSVKTNDKSLPNIDELQKNNEIAKFDRESLKTVKTAESDGKQIFLLEKMASELNSLYPELKHVKTNDKSSPNVRDFQKLSQIENFDRQNLNPTKTAESSSSLLFVSETLAAEINAFDQTRLKSVGGNTQEKGVELKIENFNEWLLENTENSKVKISENLAAEIRKYDQNRLKSTDDDVKIEVFTDPEYVQSSPDQTVLVDDDIITNALKNVPIRRRQSTCTDLTDYLNDVQKYIEKCKKEKNETDGTRMDDFDKTIDLKNKLTTDISSFDSTKLKKVAVKDSQQELRNKVKVEIELFKQWWLKNVDILDKSNPDFTPNLLQVVHKEVEKYDATKLRPTRVAEKSPTLDFVKNLITHEITSYKPETLKSVETKVKNQMPTSEELLGDKLKTEQNLTRNDVRNIVRRNSIVNEDITNFNRKTLKSNNSDLESEVVMLKSTNANSSSTTDHSMKQPKHVSFQEEQIYLSDLSNFDKSNLTPTNTADTSASFLYTSNSLSKMITTFNPEKLRSTSTSDSTNDELNRKNVRIEIEAFNKWCLQNVQVPNSKDLQIPSLVDDIKAFNFDSLSYVKPVESSPNALYVSEVLAKEIQHFNKRRLSSTGWAETASGLSERTLTDLQTFNHGHLSPTKTTVSSPKKLLVQTLVVDEVKHFKRDRLKSFEEDSPIFFEKPSQVFCSNMPEDTEFLSDSDKNNEITPPEEKLGSASENLFPSTGWAETASGLPEKTLADLQTFNHGNLSPTKTTVSSPKKLQVQTLVVDELKNFKKDRLKSSDSAIFMAEPSEVFCSNMPPKTMPTVLDENKETLSPDEGMGSSDGKLKNKATVDEKPGKSKKNKRKKKTLLVAEPVPVIAVVTCNCGEPCIQRSSKVKKHHGKEYYCCGNLKTVKKGNIKKKQSCQFVQWIV